MELKITRETRRWDLKNQFARLFPYLKLEFAERERNEEKPSVAEERICVPATFLLAGRLCLEGSFVFTPLMTVHHFKEKLLNEYGLAIQVFQKACDVWIETIQTENLSLEKQNAMGHAGSIPIHYNLNCLFL